MLAGTAGLLYGRHPAARAAPVGPRVIIAQLKVTSGKGQFITLYNNSNQPLDLSAIQLQYFNNYDLQMATSSKLISLSGTVPARGYAVVNDGAIQACYQMTVNSASLGMSTTSGFVQVAHFISDTPPRVVATLDDYVGWSKSAVTGAQTLPADSDMFLQRQVPDDSQDYSSISMPGAGSWMPVEQTAGASCAAGAASVASGGGFLRSGNAPIPYSIVSSASLSSIPADDSGLAAPQISEVLPNPAPPKTDANDEFIELYNSNDKPFDLSGFGLQVGTSTTHKYTFQDGTLIQPRQFTAFYSSDTGLSLSNSGGQVKLFDPGGNLLGQTDEYGTAKDDYAYVFAGGLWQWTTAPTPGAANKIATPVSKTTTSGGSSSKTAVKGAKTSAAKTTSSAGDLSQPAVSNLHPLVLAMVGAAAVLYALYEYRYDLGNLFYKLRRNRQTRRAIG